MKVLIGSFTAESNSWNPFHARLEDFDMFYGDDVLNHMFCRDVFAENNIEAIPTICAHGGSKGHVEMEAFRYIADKIIDSVKENKDILDGVLLYLHGASYIIDLPEYSGETYILRKVREIVGPDMPIAVTMDPHGNLGKDYQLANIVRCYRHSPHWDREECYHHVAELFAKLLKRPRNIHPAYVRMPIMIGGERSVSAEEPVSSINKLLDEIETLEGIMSASYHIGYAHADSPVCCGGVIVVPEEEAYQELAEEKAKEIARFAFDRRKEFTFTGYALKPEQAIRESIETNKWPVFVTDAGDNATGGAMSYNTSFLKAYMALADLNNKKLLFAAIQDPRACQLLLGKAIGAEVEFDLGVHVDADSQPVHLTATVIAKGDLNTFYAFPHRIGDAVTVKLKDREIYIVVTNHLTAFREVQQFAAAGLDYQDFDVIIVKQGYLYTEEVELAGLAIMALTDGITFQETELLPFNNIIRPLYPFDQDFDPGF